MNRIQAPQALFAIAALSAALATAGAASAQDDERGFANPQLLVTTSWLAEHGTDKGVIILDVRAPQDFASGHVPAARNLPVADVYSPTSRGNIASSEQLAAALSARGVSAQSHIVLYDEGGSIPAARVFWTLEVYGHEHVSVVDGGFAKWKAEERATSAAAAEIKPQEYVIAAASKRLSTHEQVFADVEQPDVVMLDARSVREYDGGRIPGAVHIEWTHNYTDDEVPVFKSAVELRKLYRDQGVIPDKRVHAY